MKRVLVIGMARSGIAAARLLHEKGNFVILNDRKSEAELGSVLDGLRLFEDITAADSTGHTFYILPDGSYILSRDGEEMLCGEAWLMHNGVLEKLTEDSEELAL